jgi:hypothetical protein
MRKMLLFRIAAVLLIVLALAIDTWINGSFVTMFKRPNMLFLPYGAVLIDLFVYSKIANDQNHRRRARKIFDGMLIFAGVCALIVWIMIYKYITF